LIEYISSYINNLRNFFIDINADFPYGLMQREKEKKERRESFI